MYLVTSAILFTAYVISCAVFTMLLFFHKSWLPTIPEYSPKRIKINQTKINNFMAAASRSGEKKYNNRSFFQSGKVLPPDIYGVYNCLSPIII